MWRIKILAKIILSRLPFGYFVWQKIGLFRHGNMDNSTYAIRVFNDHIAKSGLQGKLQGLTILELGPGDSIATAIIAASHGARAILVDSGRFIAADPGTYITLCNALIALGVSPPDISRCQTVDDILSVCNSKFLSGGLSSLKEIAGNSIDLIFSQAVLEHVRAHDFQGVLFECFRILKETGVSSHCIDLKDHIGGGLNNLRFKRLLWESNLFCKSGFYTNRIRLKKILESFSIAGFSYRLLDVKCWDRLPIQRKNLDLEFSRLDDDELLVSEFDVLLYKIIKCT